MRSLFVFLALASVVAARFVIPDQEDAPLNNQDAPLPTNLVPLSEVQNENRAARMFELFGSEETLLACFEPGCNQQCRYYHYDGGRCLEGTCYCWYWDAWDRSQGASK